MTASPITLTDGSGVVRFEGTQSPGGGSQPGAVRILKHDFDFSQAAALNAGVTVFTPAADDFLLDAWIETDDPPNGWGGGVVPALADIGIIAAGSFVPFGLWSIYVGNPFDLKSGTWDVSSGKIAFISDHTNAGPSELLGGAINLGAPFGPTLTRFQTTDPLQLVVSADGAAGGGETDAEAGASTLYIVVSTPSTTP